LSCDWIVKSMLMKSAGRGLNGHDNHDDEDQMNILSRR